MSPGCVVLVKNLSTGKKSVVEAQELYELRDKKRINFNPEDFSPKKRYACIDGGFLVHHVIYAFADTEEALLEKIQGRGPGKKLRSVTVAARKSLGPVRERLHLYTYDENMNEAQIVESQDSVEDPEEQNIGIFAPKQNKAESNQPADDSWENKVAMEVKSKKGNARDDAGSTHVQNTSNPVLPAKKGKKTVKSPKTKNVKDDKDVVHVITQKNSSEPVLQEISEEVAVGDNISPKVAHKHSTSGTDKERDNPDKERREKVENGNEIENFVGSWVVGHSPFRGCEAVSDVMALTSDAYVPGFNHLKRDLYDTQSNDTDKGAKRTKVEYTDSKCKDQQLELAFKELEMLRLSHESLMEQNKTLTETVANLTAVMRTLTTEIKCDVVECKGVLMKQQRKR